MQYVPARPFHVLASRSRIVVSKAVDYSVPDWAIMLDQESLRQLDPDRNHDQKTAAEILKAEVLCLLNGFGMLG